MSVPGAVQYMYGQLEYELIKGPPVDFLSAMDVCSTRLSFLPVS
ncbi:hypothetical protein SXCC_01210 [Gluconacetobacter sp. SXCC-1]|nr:hypothetical protein SXCC_01210 [Gluconacetobacter sp. SXCC-1]